MAGKKDFDKNGKISLWERTRSSDGEKFISGNVEIDGLMYNITLNYNHSDNPKAPTLIGKIKEAE